MTTSIAQDHFADANGLKFHYRTWGDAGSPPLLLLHGVSSNTYTWDELAEGMSDRYHVFALDQRGHGESDWAPEYAMDALVSDIGSWADAVGLGSFDLVGHSMGGVVGFSYAAEHPERVGRLVIVDIGPDVTTSEGVGNVRQNIAGAISARFPSVEAAIAYNSTLENNRFVAPSILARRTRAGLVQKEDGWAPRFDAAGIAQAGGLIPPEPLLWDVLHKVSCPTLLVRGAESPLLSDATAQRVTKEMKDCRLVTIDTAAHGVPTDNPAAFLEAVRSFLSEA